LSRHLTLIGLIGYLFTGTAAVLIPSAMPFITDEYTSLGLSLAAIGLIFPARAVGQIIGNLLAGVGSDRFGRIRLVWLSALILAASLMLTAATSVWLLLLVGLAFVGAAQSALSTGINALVTDANRHARARALNTLHGLYGAGAAISPLLIGYLLDLGMGWRWTLGGTGAIWFLYGVGVYFANRGEQPFRADAAAGTFDLGMLRMLGNGAMLSLFIVAFIYNGVAYSLLGWVAVFMQQSAGLSAFLSAGMISVFYVALTLGRFGCAVFAERIGYAATFLILAAGITLTYPLVFFGSNPWVMVAGVFLTGLGLSGLFPMALAYGSRLFPAKSGMVTGILSVAMTFGGMIPPLWTGVLADAWGLQVALGVNYVLVLPLIFLGLYLRRSERRQADNLPAPAPDVQPSPRPVR